MIERNEQEIDVGQEVLDLAPDKMDIVIRHELAAEILAVMKHFLPFMSFFPDIE